MPDQLDRSLAQRDAAQRPSHTLHAVTSPERLRAMFDAHYAQVWRVLRRLGVPSSASDDAAQEVFVIAARRLGDIEPAAEQAFLLGVARRVAAAARRRDVQHACEQEMLDLAHPDPLPEQALCAAEERRMLDLVLAELDDETREVFVLFELEGLARSEVAALLAIPEGTAASRLRRARAEFLASAQRLKARLAHAAGGRR
jgi:RNA polymerase sigma-70 factor (ECF subfamily)